MKFNKRAKASVIALALVFNNVSVYATDVITATNTNRVKNGDISIISSNNGETVSKMDNLNSVFRISFKDDNYITTKFAKVINNKDKKDYVPVYLESSDKSGILGSIPVDSIVVVGSQKENFTQIFFDDRIAYIDKQYLIDSKPEQKPKDNTNNKPTGKYVKITANTGVNFRKEASQDSESLGVIPNGTYVDYLDASGGWLKVKHNGKTGYISSEFVSITDKKETPQASKNVTAENVINFAKSHLGKPYIYGSTNLNVGTDCSGFTYAVFKHFGININRVSKDQYLNGTPVEKDNLLPGDLVFFNTGGNTSISHVGIYIGNNEYIHSTDSKNRGVIISKLNSSYGLKTYYGARRVIPR